MSETEKSKKRKQAAPSSPSSAAAVADAIESMSVRSKAGNFNKLAAERAFAAWAAGESTVNAKDKGIFDKDAVERAFEAWAHGGFDESEKLSAAQRSKTFGGRIKNFSGTGKNKNGIFEFWHKLNSAEQEKAFGSSLSSSADTIRTTKGDTVSKKHHTKQRTALNAQAFQFSGTGKSESLASIPDSRTLSQPVLVTSSSTPTVPLSDRTEKKKAPSRTSGHQRKKSLPGLFSSTISGATNPLKKDRKEGLKKIDLSSDEDIGSPLHMLSLARTTSVNNVELGVTVGFGSPEKSSLSVASPRGGSPRSLSPSSSLQNTSVDQLCSAFNESSLNSLFSIQPTQGLDIISPRVTREAILELESFANGTSEGDDAWGVPPVPNEIPDLPNHPSRSSTGPADFSKGMAEVVNKPHARAWATRYKQENVENLDHQTRVALAKDYFALRYPNRRSSDESDSALSTVAPATSSSSAEQQPEEEEEITLPAIIGKKKLGTLGRIKNIIKPDIQDLFSSVVSAKSEREGSNPNMPTLSDISQQKAARVNLLKDILQKKRTNRIFGCPLETIDQVSLFIPAIVSKLLQSSIDQDTGSECIFTRKLESEALDTLKNAIEEGTANFEETSDFELMARIVYDYFVELPHQLIPPRIYSLLQDTMEINDLVYRQNSIRLILYQLPPPARYVLGFIVPLLQKLKLEHAKQLWDIMIKRVKDAHDSFEASYHLFDTLLSGWQDAVSLSAKEIKYEVNEGTNTLLIMEASVNKLLETVCNIYHSETEFTNAFFATYSYFVTPKEIFTNLWTLYISSAKSIHLWEQKRGKRALNELKHWLTNYAHELVCDPEFVSSVVEKIDGSKETAGAQFTHFSFLKTILLGTKPETGPKPKSIAGGEIWDILNMDATKIAQQLASVDHAMMKAIPITELILKRLGKPDKSPRFTIMANQFNKWSLWVPTEVFKYKNAQKQGDVLVKFIKIAQACFKINNLNACFAIVLGLEHSSLSRLKLAWKKVSKKYRIVLDDLIELFNPSFNFKKYREELAEMKVPFIPYMGLISKDIATIEENHNDVVERQLDDATETSAVPVKMVNFQKMRLLWQRCLSLVFTAQGSPFPYEIDECGAYLLDMKVLSEEETREFREQSSSSLSIIPLGSLRETASSSSIRVDTEREREEEKRKDREEESDTEEEKEEPKTPHPEATKKKEFTYRVVTDEVIPLRTGVPMGLPFLIRDDT